jgi:hypothetical protein
MNWLSCGHATTALLKRIGTRATYKIAPLEGVDVYQTDKALACKYTNNLLG